LSLQIWKNQFAGSVPHGVLATTARPLRSTKVGQIEARQSSPIFSLQIAISSSSASAYL
jgi:hypothetical protein